MRKTVTLLIALLALCVSSWAQSQIGPIDGFYYEIDGSGNATLIKLPGSDDWESYELSGDITIPGTVNDGVEDHTVTAIGSKAFVNGGITSVTIEEGVTDINELAFFGSSLQTATLPSTITYLGNQSFDFTALTTFVITATSPASFGSGDPFSNVSTLEHIYVPAASVDAYKTTWASYASLIEEKPVWIKWYQTNVESVNLVAIDAGDYVSQTVKDITVTASSPESGDYAVFSTGEYGNSISIRYGGTITFAPTSGKLKGISISCGGYEEHEHLAAGSGWKWNNSKYALEWSGDAATSVVLACDGSSDGIYFGQNTSIVFTLEAEEESDPDPDPEPVGTTITWDAENLDTVHVGTGESQTIKTITVTNAANYAAGQYCHFLYDYGYCGFSMNNNGSLTFAPESGQLTSIVIAMTNDYEGALPLPLVEGSEWTLDPQNPKLLKWTGNAASVTLQADGTGTYLASGPISSIVFTVVPATPEPTETATIHFAEIYHSEITEFTHTDDDCGHRNGFLTPLFNVWLENENEQAITDVMPLTVTSSDESVVTVSLGDYYDDPNDPDRLITCQPTGYGTATITATFAGNETYLPTQASFTYHFYRNETPMAECALVDKDGVPVTSIVATEGDLIDAPHLARKDGEDLCYTYLAMATTTNRSRWRRNPSTNHWDYFYPMKAGLDTIVFTYYRESSFDSRETEHYEYWDQGVEVRIPVQINPLITPIGASAQMNMNPATNANMSFSNTENDSYNSIEKQLEIQSVVDPVALQLAIDSMAAGTKDWNNLLPGATTFNVEPGKGKLNIQCETTAGYELKVLVRGQGTVSVSQPSMGIAKVDYDVDEVTTVLIYLAATSGGSSAPKRVQAAKKAGPKAIIKAISVIPMVEVTAKPDPDSDNGDVYYSTFYDSEKKYQLPAGTEAYVAELNTNELLMTKIAENGQVIPAGNAVILKSEAASVDLIATDDAPVSFSATNHLHGVDSETDAPANCYVLSGHSTDNSVTGVGFYEFTGKIPAHKAYLTISGGAAYAPKKLRFVFNNEQQATGIDNAADGIMSEKRIENGQLVIIKNGVRYNAQGQVIQ
jgi:uncharacterized protein YaiE (UPF0345 family)